MTVLLAILAAPAIAMTIAAVWMTVRIFSIPGPGSGYRGE